MANICVVVVVVVLGILACVLGIAGAVQSLKSSDFLTEVSSDNTCQHRTKPGLGLGVIASLCILAAQITANVAARTCICCCNKRRTDASRQCCAIVCLVLSWLLAISSFSNLLSGGILNSSSYPVFAEEVNGVVICNYSNPVSYLAAGVVGALLATILVLVFYFKATSNSTCGSNVEMPTAQPYHVQGYPPGYPK